MLFLAVFCGFLAENIREHKVEDLRAKEFARALVQDLSNDTAALRIHKNNVKHYISICDTLLELDKTRLEGPNATKFSFYTRFMYWTAPIIWNRATFEQIKNSGSLRYFKNNKLLEKLIRYDVLINDIEMEAYNRQVRGNLLLNQINQIIDPVYHQKLSKYFIYTFDTLSTTTIENLYPVNPESLESKRSEVRELLNMIVVQQRNLRREITDDWIRAEQMADELINELNKEYHD